MRNAKSTTAAVHGGTLSVVVVLGMVTSLCSMRDGIVLGLFHTAVASVSYPAKSNTHKLIIQLSNEPGLNCTGGDPRNHLLFAIEHIGNVVPAPCD